MYNTGKYIERCLASCYSQDLPEGEYEVVVINDGSTDKGGDIVKAMRQKHANLVYIEQENQGQGLARNHGLRIARGKYVWFLDSDDEAEKNCLGHLTETASKDNLDVLFFNEVLRYEDGRPDFSGEYKGMPYYEVLTGEECYRRGFQAYAMSGCFTRRKFLTDHQLAFRSKRVGEDAELCYQIMAYAERVEFVPNIPYIYHINGTSVTQANKQQPSVIRQQLRDTIAVGETLTNLAAQLKDNRPVISHYLSYWSRQTIFGALLSIWKNRKLLADEGLLKPLLHELRTSGILPFHVPVTDFKKFLITHILINRL